MNNQDLTANMPAPTRKLVEQIERDLHSILAPEARSVLKSAGVDPEQFEQLLKETKIYLLNE